MVSNVRLAQIHLRLEEIFGKTLVNNESFGGLNILLFGDFMQVLVTSNIVVICQ